MNSANHLKLSGALSRERFGELLCSTFDLLLPNSLPMDNWQSPFAIPQKKANNAYRRTLFSNKLIDRPNYGQL